MRAEVVSLVATLGEEAERLQVLRRRFEQAAGRRDRLRAVVERKLRVATGGLELRHFEAGRTRRRVNTVEDAVARARAVRRRAGVEAAAERFERVRREGDTSVAAVGAELASLAEVLLARGHVGVQLSGLDADELRGLLQLRGTKGSPRSAMSAAKGSAISLLRSRGVSSVTCRLP